jgi:hypothetical protein
MSDIQMTRGDSAAFEVEVTRYNEITRLDEPVNLTGAKAWFTVKRRRTDLDVDAIVQRNSVVNPSEIQITPLEGLITIQMLPTDTQDITERWLRYDVQIKELSGAITTVQAGSLELIKDTTITNV